ncbi:M48 family metallopeptidase [Rubrivivax gelatinosus]|uniref:Peptidase M48-like protein n=1 Tax=Rubrivivax gelatinosus TaxID=28068 RepID=A0A4V2SG93_RUBGE|nr:M48 family metallopeptidase [Rubrivivax gelatinosus]MBK1689880.1 peptidase M48 [Rubrivivax gelatinosus]TCP00388.1 peptidase M48-like protein [Rubrivivax gelatinosus]
MQNTFDTDARIELPPMLHAMGCRCPLHGRRLFTGALAAGAGVAIAGPALAQEGVRGDVGSESKFTKLVPAEDVEQAAAQQYEQMLREARAAKALAPADHPQLVRLRSIADRIIPYAQPWNRRAANWKWEINLIGSKQLNAFCMPGGKIAFYFGILKQLQLSDDEVATIMGHEVAHALREHARERMGKTAATRIGAGLVSALLGLGQAGDTLLNMGGQLLTLKFSREDESEADIVGMDLAARSGYDPRAGVSLWKKMIEANKNAPPEFMSTHPSGPTRIADIEAKLPKVMPLYERAAKPARQYGPPARG